MVLTSALVTTAVLVAVCAYWVNNPSELFVILIVEAVEFAILIGCVFLASRYIAG